MMQTLNKLNQKFLLVPKLLYFTVSAAFYVFHQFRSQFITERYSLEKDDLGLYLSLPQALSFFFNTWIASLNDRSGRQKAIILTLLTCSAVFFQFFFVTNSLFLFTLCFIWYFMFLSCTLPLLDKVMIDYIMDFPDLGASALGRQRLWSTFGYLACNFSVEDMITKDGESAYDYDKMQYFNVFVVAVAAVCVFLFVRNIPRRTSSRANSGSVWDLIKNTEYLYFIFIILLCGISRAFMTNYLGIYYSKVLQFKDQPNNLSLFWPLNHMADFAYSHKQSVSTVFGVTLEILLFFKSQSITERFGFFWPILIGQGLQFLRFVFYYNLDYDNDKSFAICCLIELLKGANYALIHVSALLIANSFCPPHLRTRSQLFYNGAFVALGSVMSGVVFKFFFTKGGAKKDVAVSHNEFRTAFRWNAYLTLATIVFFIYKYGIRENLLFNRANADRKIKEMEDKYKDEDETEELEGNDNNASPVVETRDKKPQIKV